MKITIIYWEKEVPYVGSVVHWHLMYSLVTSFPICKRGMIRTSYRSKED